MATPNRTEEQRTPSLTERLAPQSMEAERAVLGSIMLNADLFNQAAQHIKPEDFFLESHRKIFRAFALISERSNRGASAIDLVTLIDALGQIGTVEEVGGKAYLASLVDGLPRYSNIEQYARIVRDKAVLRMLIDASTRIANDSFSATDDVPMILERAQSMIFKISEAGYAGGGFQPISNLVSDTVEKLSMMVDTHSGITGIASGFNDFDGLTSGLHGSDLIILAARPGMGKTSFALNIATNVAAQGKSVGVFSLEMDIHQLFLRLLCAEARVNSQKVRGGFLGRSDFDKLVRKADVLMNHRVFIDDSPALGVMEARSKARRLKAEHGLDLLLIDYLQLMSTSVSAENRNLAIGEITRGLKALAKELRIPIIVLSQLSRGPETRGDHRPMLADLRESGNIEQDADLVCFLFREEYYEREKEEVKGKAELIVAKNRNGPVGTVNLVFFSDYTRFQDYTPPPEEEM